VDPVARAGVADGSEPDRDLRGRHRRVGAEAEVRRAVDRESAKELLTKRLDEAAKKRAADEAAEQANKDAAKAAKKTSTSSRTSGSSGSSKKDDGGVIADIAGSKQFKDFLHDSGQTLAKEIARGVFKIGRR
jgi:hypothetical protein